MEKYDITKRLNISQTRLNDFINEYGKANKIAIPDTFRNLVSMYYSISEKRGIEPIYPIAECAIITDFATKEKNVNFRNPAGIKFNNSDDITLCHSWVHGILLHLDRIASQSGVKDYPRYDTPDLDNFVHHNEGWHLDSKTLQLIEDIKNNNIRNNSFHKDNLELVTELRNKKVLTDVDYWTSVLDGTKTASSDIIKCLFENIKRM